MATTFSHDDMADLHRRQHVALDVLHALVEEYQRELNRTEDEDDRVKASALLRNTVSEYSADMTDHLLSCHGGEVPGEWWPSVSEQYAFHESRHAGEEIA